MPPEPTSATRVSRRYFDDDWETAPATFHGFIDHVRTRMLSVGYPLPTVFGVGCDGFALVLPMERLRADGRRVEGQDGFAGPGQRSMFDFWGLVQQLIDARPGFYRVIVIVVTTERLHGFADPARPEQLVRLQRMGADELPDQLARRSLRRDYEIYALVYEFEHGRNHAGGIVAERIPPDGRLPPITHLRQAGLIGTRR